MLCFSSVMRYIVLCIFIVALAIVWQYFWNKSIGSVTISHQYDFIIIGGGTAGSVVAGRLSEKSSVRVLLLEAGGLFGRLADIPAAPTLLQRGAYDWSYSTEPQKYSSFGLNNQKQYLPRGKGLGGSGSINYMLHGTGVPSDFDNWVQLGAHSWNYTDLEPYLRRSFVYTDCNKDFSDISPNSLCCDKNLPKFKECIKQLKQPVIILSNIDDCLQEIAKAFIKSCEEITKYAAIVAQTLTSTIYNGKRESSFKSYLEPALQKENINVLDNALVTKINFKNKLAKSVDVVTKDGKVYQVAANKEIILCAGSINTPQLLMLSGIGPKEELDKLKLPIVALSEGVGKNLHDHLNMPMYISIEKPISVTLNKIYSFNSIFNYLWKGTGYLSSPGVVAVGRGPEHTALILFAMGSADEVLLREIANYKPETFRALFPFYEDTGKEGFILLSTCLHPSSRGYVKLKSRNPRTPPLINPQYLHDRRDIQCTLKAIHLAINLMSMPTFQNLGAVIHWPKIKECQHLWTKEQVTDSYLECIMRVAALTGHHSAGTCSMAGNTPVVDEELRVHGVDGLSIVDASVIPSPLSSTPNSVIIAIAERAAHIIQQRHNIIPNIKSK